METERFYEEWNNKDDDPNLSSKADSKANIELNLLQPSDTNLTGTSNRASNTRPRVIRKKSERMSVRFARLRSRGNERREMENRAEDGEDDHTESSPYANTLRIIKIAALLLIGACGLVGLVFSKITFVSITSRMYTLYSNNNNNNQKSTIFFQLVFILVIPEIMCLGHCLIWGCIGKTSKTFPWPSWRAMLLVSIQCSCV